MYLQCLMISRNMTKADEEIQRIRKHTGKTLAQVYQSKEYIENVRANNNFIDSGLTVLSAKLNQSLKKEISKHKVDVVLVSPLDADITTCLDLFGENENIEIIIDPSLAPRVNSFASVSVGNHNLLQKFKKSPSTKLVQHDAHWYASFGNLEVKDNDQAIDECLQELRINKNYETLAHYHQRLGNFKKGLLKHMAKGPVLEALTSTGLHEDYSLVNNIPFKFGEARSQFLPIQTQIQVQMENPSLPFCCS